MTDSTAESQTGDSDEPDEIDEIDGDTGSSPGGGSDNTTTGAETVAVSPRAAAPTGEPASSDQPTDENEQSPETRQDQEHSGLLSDRYRIETTLGEGAMGKVFRGQHVLMEKTVAIKVLRREMLENDEMIARFQREARAAAALDHPNVCQATDFGRRDDGSFFLVMEYLEGRTLQEVLENADKLSVQRTLHIARQTASALAQAHSEGIVHRDLKPENIMLIDRGGDADTVKIMDFGIARLVATSQNEEDNDEPRLTREGMVYGTPHYMSPEQVAGDDVDARTDVYALGVVLFEMLTGAPPFDGDNIARVMGKHITEPIPDLRRQHANFPEALIELLERLLAKDADVRPASGSEVVDAIDEITDKDTDSSSTGTEFRRRLDDVADTARQGGRRAADAVGPGIEAAAEHLGPVVEKSMTTAKVAAGNAVSTARAGATTALHHVHDTSRKFRAIWSEIPSTQRRLVAGLTAALVCTGIATLFAISLMLSADRQAAAIDDQREQLLEVEEVAEAIDLAAAGDRTQLDELLEKRDGDPHLRYLALEADLDANRSVDLVDEAAQILQLDGRYAHDPELVERLNDLITSSAHGEAARELIAEHINETFRDDLAERARIADRGSMRDAAYELLEENDQLSRLSDWQRVTAEMRQTTGCSALEEKINQLRSIGDARALPTLEAYQATPTRGCGTLNLQDCIGCIRADLAEAVEELHGD